MIRSTKPSHSAKVWASTSVDLVGIIMRIEGHYHIRLSHAELEKVVQVKDLIDLIESKLTDSATETPIPKAA